MKNQLTKLRKTRYFIGSNSNPWIPWLPQSLKIPCSKLILPKGPNKEYNEHNSVVAAFYTQMKLRNPKLHSLVKSVDKPPHKDYFLDPHKVFSDPKGWFDIQVRLLTEILEVSVMKNPILGYELFLTKGLELVFVNNTNSLLGCGLSLDQIDRGEYPGEGMNILGKAYEMARDRLPGFLEPPKLLESKNKNYRSKNSHMSQLWNKLNRQSKKLKLQGDNS